MNENAIIYRQIFVSGVVQGVYFRESTRQLASQLQLRGGVRNLADGRVEVLVAGNVKAVESLINWLKTGPKFAKVSTIEVVEPDASDRDSGLLLRHLENDFAVWPTK
jgi:acylphosphatase